MKNRLTSIRDKFMKTWWIIAIIYIILAIFVLPPLIFANFNIKVKINDSYTILDLPALYKEGTHKSFSKLKEISEYSTSKIPEENKWPGMVEISGSTYILKYFVNTAIVLTLAYLVILYKYSEVKKDDYKDIEHGSSDWADEKEIYSKFTQNQGIILAEKIAINIDTKVKGNKNVLVIGNTGSGKSAGFVMPNVMQNLGSYVFTDPKGELFDYSAKYYESQGYDIKVLNLKNPKNSDGYNPVVNAESDIDLDIIARTIVLGQQDGGGSDEPYFTDNAQVLLKSLIRFLKETRPESEQNLTSCANLVRATASGDSQNMLLKLMQILPEDHMARKDFESVSLATEKAFSSIASTLQSLLAKFETPDIAALTSTNTIDFASIGKKKTALYVISSDTNSTFDFLLTIFFSQMLDKLYAEADANGGALQIPVMFFLDEFANIGKIPDFDRKIATARSRRLSFNVILQSLEQLENIYGNNYETIVGNCDTHLFLGSTSAKTLEYFSKGLGEKTIEITQKNKVGEEDETRSQKLGRALMTPDEIRRLPYDECLIFSSGVKPIRAKKYFYFNHKESEVPSKYETDHMSYKVDRGYWNSFSLNKFKKEAQKKAMDKLIQGKLEINNAVQNNSANTVRPIEEIAKPVEKKIDLNLNSNLNLNVNNNIDNNTTRRKLNFNLGEDETEAKNDNLSNDHINNFKTNGNTDNENKEENNNSNNNSAKWSEGAVKEEIESGRKISGLKDINKERFLTEEERQKEIENSLENKFKKLFGEIDEREK